MRQYARFAAAPIGPGLTVLNGGLLLTTNADGLNLYRSARGDTGRSSGTPGYEATFWGDAPLSAVVGIVNPGASLATFPGGDAAGLGWRLDTGQVFAGGAVVASGLPVIGKNEIVGVQVDFPAGKVRFYRGPALVHERNLPGGGVTWYPAVSLASANAGELVAAINAGQWQSATPAGKWAASDPAAATLRLSDMHWLSASGDAPANARFEGIIEDGGFDTLEVIHFWPWGAAPTAASTATLRIVDPGGRADALLDGTLEGLPVAVQAAGTTLAGAAPVGRYVLAGAEVEDDMRRTVTLADAHDDLGEPLNPGVFLPNIPQLAWQPQPLVIGAVSSIPALSANSDATALFLSDAPLAAIDTVRDRGDVMEPGTFSLAPGGQQLLMQSPSLGPVAVNASSIGSDANGLRPATLEQLLRECFRRIGKSAWSSADAAAIDAATGYAGIGFASRDVVSAWDAITAALNSYGAWLWRDATGVLRFSRVMATESVADEDLDFEIDESQLLRDVRRMDDRAPALTRRMWYRPNAYMHGPADLVTDLVDVPPSMRERLMSPGWGQVFSDKPISPIYRHADTAPPGTMLFWREQDAQAELDRVVSIYAMARTSWAWEVQDTDLDIKPGMVGRIKYSRYPALAGGRKVQVRGLQRNAITGRTVLTLWG